SFSVLSFFLPQPSQFLRSSDNSHIRMLQIKYGCCRPSQYRVTLATRRRRSLTKGAMRRNEGACEPTLTMRKADVERERHVSRPTVHRMFERELLVGIKSRQRTTAREDSAVHVRRLRPERAAGVPAPILRSTDEPDANELREQIWPAVDAGEW